MITETYCLRLVYDIEAVVTLEAESHDHAIWLLDAIERAIGQSLKGSVLRVSDTMLVCLDGLRYASVEATS